VYLPQANNIPEPEEKKTLSEQEETDSLAALLREWSNR